MATIEGTSSSETLHGTSGNDVLIGRQGINRLFGDGGNDVFMMVTREFSWLGNYDVIGDFQTGDRIDVSAYGIGSFDQLKYIMEEINGDGTYINAYYAGSDFVIQFAHVAPSELRAQDFIFYTGGAKQETGTDGFDSLFGGAFNDVLDGRAGNDKLLGGDGDDILMGGTFANGLYGQGGDDIFKVQARKGPANAYSYDIIRDFETGDKVDVSAYGISSLKQLKLIFEMKDNADVYFDAFFGGHQNAVQITNIAIGKLTADDFIFASGGAQNVTGSTAADRLFGGKSGDTLDGRGGNDELFGGVGNDTLIGGSGTNTVYGLSGNDVFLVQARAGSTSSKSIDTIIDFTVGDRVDVSAYGISDLAQLKLIFETKNGSDAFFNAYFGGTEYSVQFKNFAASSLKAGDFIFDTAGSRNADGTDGIDRLFGGSAGGVLNGLAGDDQLFGGAGNDTLNGGAGSDRLTGGAGNDTYVLGAGADKVVDTAGSDTITSTITRSLGAYGTIETLRLLGSGDTDGTGNALANLIVGNSGDNRLSGGKDSVTDTLTGGAGNDTFDLSNGKDIVIDSSGMDTITSTISRDLRNYTGIENLTLLGSANINAVGDALANILTGNSGDNILDGGAGNDTYVLGASADKVIDAAGNDTITSTITRSLDAYGTIETLRLLGSGDIDGTGNALENLIIGNTGDNRLSGGKDSVTDTLTGGAGNDTFDLSGGKDIVIDSSGMDTITSTISRDLRNYTGIENLTLLGSANINAVGDALANILTGNSGDNILDGGAGNDTYVLGASADKVIDAAGNDTITSTITRSLDAYGTIETLRLLGSGDIDGTGNALANLIIGNTGDNRLSGGKDSVTDTLTGGAGNDTFDLSGGKDIVIDSSGMDTITSTISRDLHDYTGIENLTLLGSANINAVGDALANILTGNSGDNALHGGAGSDILTGGAGRDSFVFDKALYAAANVDKITDFNVSEDTIKVDNLFFVGLANGVLASNAFKDVTNGKADADDRILYNSDTGSLFYDRDGSGKDYMTIKFASLTGLPHLTAEDFIVI